LRGFSFAVAGISGFKSVYGFFNEQLEMSNGEIIEPEFYRVLPDCSTDIDIPFSIEFSPALVRMGCTAIKAIYLAGYAHNSVLADLAVACLELASWNMSRYRGEGCDRQNLI
jgi:hypothetical protein